MRDIGICGMNAAPIMYGVNLNSDFRLDMGLLRLSPYRVRHVQIAASDEALNDAIDAMSR